MTIYPAKLPRAAAFIAVLAILSAVLSACGVGTPASQTGPVVMGELFPVSGRYAAFGQRQHRGAQLAVQDINKAGGILGRKLLDYPGDDAGDAVDAVPALRQLMTHHPIFMVGPSALTFTSVQSIIDSNHLVAFTPISSGQYDTLTDKWVYRTVFSDSLQGQAMAYYAVSKGYTKCVLMFENVESGQALADPLLAAYGRHGGTILDKELMVPHQSSYRAELVKAFATKPQCVFIQTDPQTSGTFFANARDLGYLNVPYVASNAMTDAATGKAIGADGAKVLVATTGATPSGPANDHYTQLYQSTFTDGAPDYFGAAMYDGVMLAAIAMTAAGSTDPNVWVNKVLTISNSPGMKVYTYAAAVAAVHQNKKIDYDGASGPLEFDPVHHMVFSDIDVEQFDASGTLHSVTVLPAASLNGY